MIFLGQATYNWRLCTFTPWCKEDRAFPQMISLADSWILTPPREWWSGAGGQCLTQICFLQNFGYWFQALFFWISGTHLGRPGFLKALPKLLNNMTENYVTGSCCKAEQAFDSRDGQILWWRSCWNGGPFRFARHQFCLDLHLSMQHEEHWFRVECQRVFSAISNP